MTTIQDTTSAELVAISSFVAQLETQGLEHIPMPNIDLGNHRVTLHVWDSWDYTMTEEQRNDQIVWRVRALAKAIGGRWSKNDPKQSQFDDDYYILTNGHLLAGIVEVRIMTQRYAMCDRKKVGTKTVTVAAVEAVAAKPEHTVEEDVYERDCKPLNTRQQQGLDSIVDLEVTA